MELEVPLGVIVMVRLAQQELFSRTTGIFEWTSCPPAPCHVGSICSWEEFAWRVIYRAPFGLFLWLCPRWWLLVSVCARTDRGVCGDEWARDKWDQLPWQRPSLPCPVGPRTGCPGILCRDVQHATCHSSQWQGMKGRGTGYTTNGCFLWLQQDDVPLFTMFYFLSCSKDVGTPNKSW